MGKLLNLQPIDWKKELKQDAQAVLGLLLMMVSYNYFFVPNQIAPGGVTGLATIIHYLWGIPVGLMSAVINIPLFLLSWKRMGTSFAARSLASMLLLSLFLDLFPSFALTEDNLLATITGGAILGVGLALVLMGNATTGGTDLAAAMIQRALPHLSFGVILLVIEMCIVTFSGFVFGAQKALYAAVSLFLTSRLVDMLQEGVASSRLFFIISPMKLPTGFSLSWIAASQRSTATAFIPVRINRSSSQSFPVKKFIPSKKSSMRSIPTPSSY